jgi:hypothetical protein
MLGQSSFAFPLVNLKTLDVILLFFPFDIDCDITANNIPDPAADVVSHVT